MNTIQHVLSIWNIKAAIRIQRQHRFKGKLQASTYIEDSIAQWLRALTANLKINGSNPDGWKKYFYPKYFYLLYTNHSLTVVQNTTSWRRCLWQRHLNSYAMTSLMLSCTTPLKTDLSFPRYMYFRDSSVHSGRNRLHIWHAYSTKDTKVNDLVTLTLTLKLKIAFWTFWGIVFHKRTLIFFSVQGHTVS